jgi:hypothetical protein
MSKKELIAALNTRLQLELADSISENLLEQKLSGFIEHLINSDFDRLVQILYKTDVNETELKKMLQTESGENAAAIITKLIIKRELQKIESRKKYSNQNDADDDDERW